MRVATWLGLTVLLGACRSPPAAVRPTRPGYEVFIKAAVFADGRLWLLTDTGEVASIDERQDHRVVEPLPEPALDLCRQAGAPVAITCDRDACSTWEVRRRSGGAWPAEASVATRGDRLVGVGCSPDHITLVSDRRVIDVVRGDHHAVTLSQPLRRGVVTSILDDHGQVLVGVNAGEWGGGLRRIDRRTGQVTPIERRDGGICDGPLTTGCDPVNGIEAEPWRPGCVAVAVGMVHLGGHRGRILEICGDEVTRIATRPYDKTSPRETVAFSALVRTGDTLWVAAIDGLRRIDKGDLSELIPAPPFREVDGVSVSFAIPDLVLVVTAINARVSVSGVSTLLVAR